MNERRIREVYQDYRKGRIPFERVVEAADAYLDRYEREAPGAAPEVGREPERA